MDTKESAEAQIISIEAGEPWPRHVFPYFEYWEGEIMKATTDMRPDEFGAFMRLIGYYWQPAKDDCHIVTGYDSKIWRRRSEKILARLKLIIHEENESGLIAQRKKCIALPPKRAAAGRKGGLARNSTTHDYKVVDFG